VVPASQASQFLQNTNQSKIEIGNLNLPNVQNPKDFLNEMIAISHDMGVNLMART
jgi:hypothetical protein